MTPLSTLLRRFRPEKINLSFTEQLRIAALALLAILVCAYISQLFLRDIHVPALVASMGASAVLLFVLPHSPLAQPWPLLGGHIISALVGVSCAKWLPHTAGTQAIAVSAAILLMLAARALHPPGAATALITAAGSDTIQQMGFQFILTPLLINLALMLIMTLLLNNVFSKKGYPAPAALSDPHKAGNQLPSERLSYKRNDLENALKDMNAFVDISRAGLEDIYQRAEMHAYRRKFGEITCKDIMSSHVVSVQYGTELEEAWALLRQHKVKALPVVDRTERVIGIITLVDFLKRANLKTYEGFEEKLIKFIRRTANVTADKPEAVGQIMAHPAFTLQEDTHIVELVPLLSDKGLHHVPIVDAKQKLVGIITQSDLIAALYRGMS